MSLRGVVVLAVSWAFFAAIVFAQFCFIALVPVLAPVYAMQVLGAACLLTEAYAYARRLPPRRPEQRGQLAAQARPSPIQEAAAPL
jgi:hypothetical protein